MFNWEITGGRGECGVSGLLRDTTQKEIRINTFLYLIHEKTHIYISYCSLNEFKKSVNCQSLLL